MAAGTTIRRSVPLLLAVLAGIALAVTPSQGARAVPRCFVRIDNPDVRNSQIVSVFRFHCNSRVRHASAYVVLERLSHRKWRKLASVKKRLDVRAGKRYKL